MSGAPTNASADVASMTASGKKGKPAKKVGDRPKMRFKHKLMLITFSVLMMWWLRTGFVFLVIGTLPAVVAYYMDISKNRYTFKTVFAANLSGMMPYITKIIATGHSSTLLQEIMGNGFNWFVIYGSAGIGWLLIIFCPMVAQIMVVGVNQTHFMRYDGLRKKLESEWGDEVKQFSETASDKN